jgi:hypothetical protein
MCHRLIGPPSKQALHAEAAQHPIAYENHDSLPVRNLTGETARLETCAHCALLTVRTDTAPAATLVSRQLGTGARGYADEANQGDLKGSSAHDRRQNAAFHGDLEAASAAGSARVASHGVAIYPYQDALTCY